MSFNQTRWSTRWSISTFLPFAEPPLAIQNRRLRPRSVSMLSITRQLAMNKNQSPLPLPFPDGKGKTSCHSRQLLSGIHLSPFSCRHVHENIFPSITRQLKTSFRFNALRFFSQIFRAICQLPIPRRNTSANSSGLDQCDTVDIGSIRRKSSSPQTLAVSSNRETKCSASGPAAR